MKHRLALAGALAIFSAAALAPEAQAYGYYYGSELCFPGSWE
jgi:hypothetical protein